MSRSTPLRVLIVDDEELARAVLAEYCSARPDVQVVGQCSNGFEAVKAVSDLNPDLLLLDIQMPKLSGFEVLELLDKPPAVVFVTAFDQFALKAFEVHALDYLLKPVRKERLFDALDRVKASSLSARKTRELLGVVREHQKPLERILIRDGSNVYVVPVDTIDYFEAQDDYVSIKTAAKKYLKQDRLTELALALDQHRFVRIHRSYILNLERLSKIEPYGHDSKLAILKDGTRLPVSRSGYDLLKHLL